MEPLDGADVAPSQRFPAMPVRPDRCAADPALAALSGEQVAAWFWLTCYAWDAETRGEPPCSVADDERLLAKVSRLGRRWGALGAVVRALFLVVSDDRGGARLRYVPQYRDYLDMAEKQARRSGAAASRWARAVTESGEHAAPVPPAPPPSPPPPPPLGADAFGRYVGTLAATANRALAEHVDARRRQLTAHIVSSDPRNEDAARTLLGAGVPLDFAARALADYAKAHNARGHIHTLGYFTGRILDAWQVERDNAVGADVAADAVATPPPSNNGRHARGNGAGSGAGTPLERAQRTAAAADEAYRMLHPEPDPR